MKQVERRRQIHPSPDGGELLAMALMVFYWAGLSAAFVWWLHG